MTPGAREREVVVIAGYGAGTGLGLRRSAAGRVTSDSNLTMFTYVMSGEMTKGLDRGVKTSRYNKMALAN